MDTPTRKTQTVAPVRKTRTVAEWTESIVPTLVIAGDYAGKRQPAAGETARWESEPASIDTVRFSDCDPFGHLNNGRYLDYFINARDFHMATFFNLDLARHSLRHHETWLVMEHQIAYLRPVRLKEEIIVVTRHLDHTDRETFVEGWMLDATGSHLKALLWSRFGYVNVKSGKKALHPRYILDILENTRVEVPEYASRDFAARTKSAPEEIRVRALRGQTPGDKAARFGLRPIAAPGSGRSEPWTGPQAVAAGSQAASTNVETTAATVPETPAAPTVQSPWLYTQSFRVRSSEVDPNLAAKPAVCLGWFQDAIIAGGAVAGYSLISSFQRGRAWAFRRYRLAWTAAIRHEDPLEARAWVSAIGEDTGTWELEVVRRESGERVFAGRCDLEYLDLATMSATAVEADVREKMRPSGNTTLVGSIAAPEVAATGGAGFSAMRAVQADDLDLSQHVAGPVILRWAADRVHAWLWEILGTDAARARVVEAELAFFAPLFFGMEVAVRGRFSGHDEERMHFAVEVAHEERVLATVHLVLRSKRAWNQRVVEARR